MMQKRVRRIRINLILMLERHKGKLNIASCIWIIRPYLVGLPSSVMTTVLSRRKSLQRTKTMCEYCDKRFTYDCWLQSLSLSLMTPPPPNSVTDVAWLCHEPRQELSVGNALANTDQRHHSSIPYARTRIQIRTHFMHKANFISTFYFYVLYCGKILTDQNVWLTALCERLKK